MARKVAEANERVQVAQKNLNQAKAELENAVVVYETTLTLVEELKPFCSGSDCFGVTTKRRTAEMTWAKTGYAQAAGSEEP